jgi:prepilin-type N-terminal cleavage/methylation domain-containing protein
MAERPSVILRESTGELTMKRERAAVRQEGFTVLETLIALTVLAIALLGLAQLVGISINQNAFARHNTVGIQLAQERLEQLRAQYNRELETGVSAATLASGSHGPVTVTLPASDRTGQQDREFLVSWTVGNAGGTRKSVSVTVTARNQNALQNKTITLNSLFSP